MTYSVRNEPGFEPTYDEDEIIEVRKGDLRAVLDAATMSMDFGSGFLDNEEVEALRKAAELLGIDPMVATPPNFQCRYGAHHKWSKKTGYGDWYCLRGCGERSSTEPVS